jgi:hypothetical protein
LGKAYKLFQIPAFLGTTPFKVYDQPVKACCSSCIQFPAEGQILQQIPGKFMD